VTIDELRGRGVLCFGGEDWWYHNRGHADMQYMRQFARHTRVLYVNSIVMRKPNLGEGRMFWRRLVRKARSMRRGLVRVADRFWVYSPLSAPVHHLPGARRINESILRGQVRLAARRVGLHRPLVWVNCPAACDAALPIARCALVYQRTDRYEDFPGVDRGQIRRFDQSLKRAADLTFFSNRELFELERGECRSAAYVDHGVDYDLFASARDDAAIPAEMQNLGRPVAGFYGGIDAHTFDLALMSEVVRLLPQVTFVLVGKSSLDESQLASQPNVRRIAQQPYERIPHFGKRFDVCLMPWNQNDWIRACNPIKLKEYLALGKPVVSTPFPELSAYADFVSVGRTPREFADCIVRAVEQNGADAPARRRARVQDHSWARKCGLVIEMLGGAPCGDASVAADLVRGTPR
jgi:glycosyltransferase involved in cell wall biosynthesis